MYIVSFYKINNAKIRELKVQRNMQILYFGPFICHRGQGCCGRGYLGGLGTSVRRHWGFSVLIPPHSSQVEWTHSKACISPSLKMVTPQGKVHLRKSKVLPEGEKEAKKVGNNLPSTKVGLKEAGRGTPDNGTEDPLQPTEETRLQHIDIS